MPRTIRGLLGIILFGLITCAPVAAQSTASVAGTVRDQSGSAMPGVTVTATQAETGLVRTTVSDASGGYTLGSLPVGPYRLEFAIAGFRTHVQTGIVLQVNSSPTVNADLALGELRETVEVQSSAPLVETRSAVIGQVTDNRSVVELPLNGRQTLDLVYLSGMATPSGTLGGARGANFGAPSTIAVAGGQANGTAYVLDGGTHNDPFNNAANPFPFPEALQEFKLETSALPAQYGYHSGASVNAVTKSGTNNTSGSIFSFYRDDALNATDPFAPVDAEGKRRGDGLNRNQFGGVIGGPIIKDRLFYFAGYQRTRIRQTPTSTFQFVPTPAMLAGDFTAITAPPCSATPIQLPAPFVNNRISPARFSPASVKLAALFPAPSDPCGRLFFDRNNDADEHVFVTKVDYQMGSNHSVFGRLHSTRLDTPGNYDGRTPMSYSVASFRNRPYSLVLGDTLILGSNATNALHVTVNRGAYRKTYVPLVDFTDLGINATPVIPDLLRMTVSGGFSLMGGPALPGETPTWTYQVVDDVTVVRGEHQFGIGANYIHTKYDSKSYLAASGNVSFTGQVTGLGLADFMLGQAASFSQGSVAGLTLRGHYIGVYAQDTWRMSPNVTLSTGLRWEPNLPHYSPTGEITHFDRGRFDAGIRSTVFRNAPAGLMFPGDEGYPGNKIAQNDLLQFAPRVGAVWDPRGEGRESVRASYGRFYDSPHMQGYVALPQMAPWGNTITVTSLPNGWDDPYAAYPGGNPVPFAFGPDMQFPLSGNYTTFPLDLKATNMDQWNASYQRQVGGDWMVSANYVGNHTRHVWTANQINPAVFIPGASTPANTNQRRVLNLQNPAEGRYYASIQELDDDGTATYNGLLLSVQRRRANGLTIQGNYTISRCITDLANYEPGVAGQAYLVPDNREGDRGRCQTSSDHILNVSTVYETPAIGGSALVRALTGGWQTSAIVTARSGSYFAVTTGVDTALTGQGAQRVNQILDDPFMPDRSFSQWLNPAAFQRPAAGTYGTQPIDAILGPGRWNVDMSLSRSFRVAAQQAQFRFEMFNVFNHLNPANPVAALNSPDFGKIVAAANEPRILQLAVKFLF